MEHQANCSQRTISKSLWRLIFILPYRKWKEWRLRVKTRRILMAMNDERLKDIGLSRNDINRLR
ncbi:DUF1127 domain-containing protein [Brenneria alni]|uniref:DUF1127 domain-containing protein n=1 Tax=Brenneria alni TaxID=71656 RepID=UPI000EF27706|nr:DUF1127 domain-containing protein [Brenneria alni]